MTKAKPNAEQLSFDLFEPRQGESALLTESTSRAPPDKKRGKSSGGGVLKKNAVAITASAHATPTAPVVVEVEPVREGELTPPLREHERADMRETAAYDLFSSAQKSAWNYLLLAAVSSIILRLAQSGVVTVNQNINWGPFTLTLTGGLSIMVIIVTATFALCFLAILAHFRARAQFRRCGLIYRSVVHPPDDWLLRYSAKGAIVLWVTLQLLIWWNTADTVHDAIRSLRWTAAYEIPLP